MKTGDKIYLEKLKDGSLRYIEERTYNQFPEFYWQDKIIAHGVVAENMTKEEAAKTRSKYRMVTENDEYYDLFKDGSAQYNDKNTIVRKDYILLCDEGYIKTADIVIDREFDIIYSMNVTFTDIKNEALHLTYLPDAERYRDILSRDYNMNFVIMKDKKQIKD